MLFSPPARARRRGRRRAALLRPHAADAREARRRPDRRPAGGGRDRRRRPRAALGDGHRPKLVHVIPNFHNPAGCTLSEGKRQRLVELSAEHGFWIFEDDPYREIRFGDDGAADDARARRGHRRARHPRLVVLEDGQPGGPGRLPDRPRRGDRRARQAAPARPTSRRTCWPRRSSSSSAARAGSTRTSSWSTRRWPSAATPWSSSSRRQIPEAEFVVPGGGYFLWLDLAEGADTAVAGPARQGGGRRLRRRPRLHARGRRALLRLSFASVPPGDVPEGIGRLARALASTRE